MEIYKYNPLMLSYDVLRRLFIKRDVFVKNFLNNITKTTKKVFIYGPRGIGKTTLLLMIYYEVFKNPSLYQDIIVIKFAEEEYGIANAKDFFNMCSANIKELSNLANTGECLELAKLFRGGSDTDTIIYEVNNFLKLNDKKLLFLIDNFNLIIEALGDKDTKRLNDFFRHDNVSFVISSPFPLDDIYREFGIDATSLDEFDSNEIVQLIERIARIEENKKILDNMDIINKKINTIYHLTGGNPRLVLMLYQMFSLDLASEVKNYLFSLLDELTPYFKARVESLQPKERKLISIIASSDGLISINDLKSKVDVDNIDDMLKWLIKNYFIREVDINGAKHFDTYERIFKIWYQMRLSPYKRQQLGAIINFISFWYDEGEINQQIDMLTHRFNTLFEDEKLKEAREVLYSLNYIEQVLPDDEKKWKLFISNTKRLIDIGEYKKAEHILKHELDKEEDKGKKAIIRFLLAYLDDVKGDKEGAILHLKSALIYDSSFVKARLNLATIYYEIGKYDDALTIYKRLIDTTGDISLYHNLALCYKAKGEYDAAIESYKKLLESTPDSSPIYYNMANVYVEKGNLDEAIDMYRKAIFTDNKNYRAYYNLAMVLLKRKNKDMAFKYLMAGHHIAVKSNLEEAATIREAILSLIVGNMLTHIKDGNIKGFISHIDDFVSYIKKDDISRHILTLMIYLFAFDRLDMFEIVVNKLQGKVHEAVFDIIEVLYEYAKGKDYTFLEKQDHYIKAIIDKIINKARALTK